MAIPRLKVRDCPGCRQERHITSFVTDDPLCANCREAGAQFRPDGSTNPQRKEGKMTTSVLSPTTLKACRYCGKETPKGSLHRHEHVMCPKRPQGAAVKQRPVHRTKRRGRPAKAIAVQIPSTNKLQACAECPYRGLESALARDLITRCVCNGMGLLAACELSRDILAMVKTS